MRIGHYAPRIWMNGGVATYIRRVGRAQSDRHHDVVYFSRGNSTSERTQEVDYLEVANDDALFSRAENLNLDILHLHRGVNDIPDDRVPTIRTVHGHKGGCPSGSRYLSRTGKPCNRAYSLSGCLWGHVVDRCGSVRPNRLANNFTQIHREIDQAEQIPTYTVSNFLREQMRRAGCAPDRLHTLHSPAPSVEGLFTQVPRDDTPRFLFLGRLVPEKGLDWVLRAIAQTDTRVHLDVAGDGPGRDEMETLAEDLGVRPQVSFHGWVEPEDIPSFMERARAVLFPSVWHEPAGLITLEAAAHGRPLIASRVGGIPEYASEEHALLVDARDVAGLAAAIDQLARNPDQANRMGREGRNAAQSAFSMDQFLERLRALYECA